MNRIYSRRSNFRTDPRLYAERLRKRIALDHAELQKHTVSLGDGCEPSVAPMFGTSRAFSEAGAGAGNFVRQSLPTDDITNTGD